MIGCKWRKESQKNKQLVCDTEKICDENLSEELTYIVYNNLINTINKLAYVRHFLLFCKLIVEVFWFF